MKNKSFLAFDLGATSGRSILGTLENGRLQMKELTRFPQPNAPNRQSFSLEYLFVVRAF